MEYRFALYDEKLKVSKQKSGSYQNSLEAQNRLPCPFIEPGLEVKKTYFMLNSTEHDIYHAHKC